MSFAAIGSAALGFLKRIPDWVLWAIGAFLFLKFVDMNAERRGREKQKQKGEADAARVESQIIATITENSNDMVRQGDSVRSHTSAEQLHDGSASLPSHHYRD